MTVAAARLAVMSFSRQQAFVEGIALTGVKGSPWG